MRGHGDLFCQSNASLIVAQLAIFLRKMAAKELQADFSTPAHLNARSQRASCRGGKGGGHC